MSDLYCGMQIFHNGLPVELLYRTDREGDAEIWKVKPLFVEAPVRTELFDPEDRITFLHITPRSK